MYSCSYWNLARSVDLLGYGYWPSLVIDFLYHPPCPGSSTQFLSARTVAKGKAVRREETWDFRQGLSCPELGVATVHPCIVRFMVTRTLHVIVIGPPGKLSQKSQIPPRADGCLHVLFVTPPNAFTDRSNQQGHSSMISEITN